MEILWWVLNLFALSVLTALFLREWTGDRFMAVRLFTYFTPWVLLLLAAAFLAALLGRRGGTALLLMVPSAAILLAYVPLFSPRSLSKAPPEGAFTVMSFNIWSKNERIEEVAERIRKERPDILLLQEVTPERFPKLLFDLKDLYPGEGAQSAFAPELMQGVVSRFPLKSCDSFRAKGQAQKVVALTPMGEVTLFNVHPLRRGDWTHRHDRLTRLLKEEVFPLEGAIIVAGDFNTTEGSQIYQILTKHLANAHREGGRGFGFTFPAKGAKRVGGISFPPMVRIDHIFYNGRLQVHRAGTLAGPAGSDHLPIFAELYPAISPSPEQVSSPARGNSLICTEHDDALKN